MSFFDNFPQETLVDLLKAYDSYISTAADAGLLTTGWTPVCVQEFYECEYENVWDPEKGDESFYYMYDNVEKMVSPNYGKEIPLNEFKSVAGARIFFEDGIKCQFDGEEEKRPLRNAIQEIEAGDAFIVGCTLLYAGDGAHQNFDEMDEPWIVYDRNGNCWFEEDISPINRGLPQVITAHGKEKPSLDAMITKAESKTAAPHNSTPNERFSQR